MAPRGNDLTFASRTDVGAKRRLADGQSPPEAACLVRGHRLAHSRGAGSSSSFSFRERNMPRGLHGVSLAILWARDTPGRDDCSGRQCPALPPWAWAWAWASAGWASGGGDLEACSYCTAALRVQRGPGIVQTDGARRGWPVLHMDASARLRLIPQASAMTTWGKRHLWPAEVGIVPRQVPFPPQLFPAASQGAVQGCPGSERRFFRRERQGTCLHPWKARPRRRRLVDGKRIRIKQPALHPSPMRTPACRWRGR